MITENKMAINFFKLIKVVEGRGLGVFENLHGGNGTKKKVGKHRLIYYYELT